MKPTGKEIRKSKFISVERLKYITMARAYRTVSHESLYILTGMIPIEVKIGVTAQIYYASRGNTNDKVLLK